MNYYIKQINAFCTLFANSHLNWINYCMLRFCLLHPLRCHFVEISYTNKGLPLLLDSFKHTIDFIQGRGLFSMRCLLSSTWRTQGLGAFKLTIRYSYFRTSQGPGLFSMRCLLSSTWRTQGLGAFKLTIRHSYFTKTWTFFDEMSPIVDMTYTRFRCV